MVHIINYKLEQQWVFPPESEGYAVAEALTQAFRYALMTQETSNASAVHRWLVTISPKKEDKFLLMVTIRYLGA